LDLIAAILFAARPETILWLEFTEVNPPGRANRSCHPFDCRYLARPMPKPIARSKTRKSVAKRFKVTASGKVLRSRASRRHLMSAKNAKKKRQLAKMGRVHKTDVARIKANLPFV
jgi:large subunit ribosomal protein L35